MLRTLCRLAFEPAISKLALELLTNSQQNGHKIIDTLSFDPTADETQSGRNLVLDSLGR